MNFITLSPALWIISQVVVSIIIVSVFSLIARKTENKIILALGFLIAASYLGAVKVTEHQLKKERNALVSECDILAASIPNGASMSDELYDMVMQHNESCLKIQELKNEHPVFNWFFSGGDMKEYEDYIIDIPEINDNNQ